MAPHPRIAARGFIKRGQRLLRTIYLRVLRLKASSHSIALGLAVGVFIGFLPIVPLQTVVVLALAFVLRCNKFTAICGTWVSNPFDLVLVYYGMYKVGRLVLPPWEIQFDAGSIVRLEVFDMGWKLFTTMSVGGLIIGVPSSILTYFISKRLVEGHRRRKALKLLKRRNSLKRRSA